MTKTSHPDSAWTPLVAPRTLSRVLVADSNGQSYRISLCVPEGAAPEGGWPSLVVLDGGALFQSVADAERRLSHRPEATGVTPRVIIGVGHDGDALYHPPQRFRDFTPGPAVADDEANRNASGGASALLTFLLDQLLPLIGETVALDPARRALLGHSLAGYFTLYALTTTPGAFSAYGAISPSLWWNPALILDAVAALPRPSSALYLAAGALERDKPGSPRGDRRMIGALEDLKAATDAAGWPDVSLTVFPDENHASVVLPAAQRFLKFATAHDAR
ncbi:alpha/beta hydrolase [Brevundimonas sp. GCM10030266]|uniref:alpha/beta hydrolase n=1 Tax=Brevundimonas sp. GCM10030266 TaxID=3273386 RepID=UPI00360C893A